MTNGLPQDGAYVSVLREGLAHDALDPAGLYLGTATGHLFSSRDRGDSWLPLAAYLPGIMCVRPV